MAGGRWQTAVRTRYRNAKHEPVRFRRMQQTISDAALGAGRVGALSARDDRRRWRGGSGWTAGTAAGGTARQSRAHGAFFTPDEYDHLYETAYPERTVHVPIRPMPTPDELQEITAAAMDVVQVARDIGIIRGETAPPGSSDGECVHFISAVARLEHALNPRRLPFGHLGRRRTETAAWPRRVLLGLMRLRNLSDELLKALGMEVLADERADMAGPPDWCVVQSRESIPKDHPPGVRYVTVQRDWPPKIDPAVINSVERAALFLRDAATRADGEPALATATVSAPPPNMEPSSPTEDEDEDSSGPKPHPLYTHSAVCMGKPIYLGDDTQVSRLFWLLAKPLGVAKSFSEVQCAVDGVEIVYRKPDDKKKARQRVRKAVSKLRAALREDGLDDHLVITGPGSREMPEYAMVRRFH